MSLPILQLKKDQDRRLKAGHVWIYNNEIDTQLTPLAHCKAGDLVVVQSHRNTPLGIAYVNPHTLLAARLLTPQYQRTINVDFFIERLQRALDLRHRLFEEPYYRWIFAESDFLPGLVVDRFNDVIVAQINTAGMEKLQDDILAAIIKVVAPKTVIWRNDTLYRDTEQLPQYVNIAYGENVNECIVRENQCEFISMLQSGQKTGWFYDHRDNRRRMAHYVKDKTVLDVFCYLGAFAIPLAKAGATRVTCVDSSKTAIDFVIENATRNHCCAQIQTHVADAFEFLHTTSQKYDVIILDPPALIKKKKDYHAGLRAYEKLNQMALALLNPNGVLFSASCSMHLSEADLLNCLRRASVNLNRPIQIIEQLHQGRDHPVHPAIVETNYLKGYITTHFPEQALSRASADH